MALTNPEELCLVTECPAFGECTKCEDVAIKYGDKKGTILAIPNPNFRRGNRTDLVAKAMGISRGAAHRETEHYKGKRGPNHETNLEHSLNLK